MRDEFDAAVVVAFDFDVVVPIRIVTQEIRKKVGIRRKLLILGLAGIFNLGLTGSSIAAGTLDPYFGNGGVVFSTSPLGGTIAAGYGVQEDGQGHILVAGVVSDATGTFHLAVWRFLSDGRPDAAFGERGLALSPGEEWAWAVGLDGEGRILAAGIAGKSWRTAERAVVRRFLDDGRPDPEFGRGGLVRVASPLGGEHALFDALWAGADGSLALAGEVSDATGVVHAAVWRFLPDGRPDSEFGDKGVAVLPGSGRETRLWALSQSDGAFFASGAMDGWKRMAVWKLSLKGILDARFGDGGVASTGRGMGRALAFDEHGGVWAAGFKYEHEEDQGVNERALLARLKADGSPDAAFGKDGARLLPGTKELPDREAFALARTSAAKFFLAGYAAFGLHEAHSCLWAIDADGAPRDDFGENGVLVLPNAPGGQDARFYALTLDGHGRVLATGFARGADGKMRVALWRVKPQ
ncbi:MAG: hypothetical protein ACHQ49_14760 [Elusimicrobiota bacterium]